MPAARRQPGTISERRMGKGLGGLKVREILPGRRLRSRHDVVDVGIAGLGYERIGRISGLGRLAPGRLLLAFFLLRAFARSLVLCRTGFLQLNPPRDGFLLRGSGPEMASNGSRSTGQVAKKARVTYPQGVAFSPPLIRPGADRAFSFPSRTNSSPWIGHMARLRRQPAP